ncbi:MAG TPA: hypothetical protein EYN67_00105 [Flavobacteriales bacterium]|nr:hypothetical protein [Flavobacteriales bacterium]
MGVFSKRPKEFERDRKLRENYDQRVSHNNTDAGDEWDEKIEELFTETRENINLSNSLLALLDEKCRATHVPVSPIVQDVRAAVVRKDPTEPDGGRISFHLFLTAVKKFEEVQIKYTATMVDSMTGNLTLDAVVVRRFKNKVMFGLSEEDLSFFDSVYLLNYAIHKFQNIWQVPEILKISPPSEHPEGAAYGAVKLAIAIAFASAIDVINKTLIEATHSASASTTSSSSVASSVSDLNSGVLSRVDELTIEKISENDYKLILNYVISYIYPSLDPKYDLWINYLALRKSRNTSIDAYAYYPTYSNTASIRLNFGHVMPDNRSEDYVSNSVKDDFLAAYKNNFRAMCATTHQFMSFNNKEQRNIINNVAQTSAYKITKDQICCLLRIMSGQGVLDKKILKMVRIMVRASSKTLSINLSARYAKKISAEFSGTKIDFMHIKYIKHRVMGMIHKVYKDWVKLTQPRIMEELYMKCKLFHDMLKSILDFVENVSDEMSSQETHSEKQKAIIAWRDIETIQTKWQARSLGHMDMILASIIEQSLNECADLSDDVIDNRIDNIVGGLNVPSNQYTIDIPDDLRERYFSDNKPIMVSQSSSVFNLSSTMAIPAIDKFNQPETSEEVIRNILKTCKMEISDAEIKNMLKESDGSSR